MERVAAVSREASFPPWTERAPAIGPGRPDEQGPQAHGLHKPLLVVLLKAAPDHQAHGAPQDDGRHVGDGSRSDHGPAPPFFRAVALVYQISPGRGSLLALCRGAWYHGPITHPLRKGGFPMKRTLLALLVGLSLLLSLAACGSGRASAQEVTEQGLAALRDLDVLALPQYWNTDGLNLDDLGDLTQAGEEVDLSAEDTAALAQAMTRHLSWQVISAQEDPGAGTASVTVSLTNLDMAPVVGQFLQEAFSDALSSALQADGQQPTEEEMIQQYLQTLTDLLNQEGLDTRTTTVEVPLTLVDGQWKITPDEAVVDALLGGLLTTGEALTSLLEESAA